MGPDGLPDQLAFALFLSAMLAVTAFPVMARILQEKGLQTSPMGVIGVAAAAVVTVLMFILLAVAKGTAKSNTIGDHLLVFLGTIAFLGIMFGIVRPLLRPLGERVREAGAVKPEVFAIVMIVMFASAYAADRIGINVIVGGFVAGVIMPERELLFAELRGRLAELTTTVLLPIFLAFSGFRTDFTTLGWAWLPGLALFVVAGIVAKWGAGAVSARLGGLTWAEGNVLGVLMNCRGLLVLLVGLIAFNNGVISPQMQVGGVLMALITTGMTGPLFDRFLPAAIAAAVDSSTPAERVGADAEAPTGV
jgi:Kef-type K+ transport system membrane component KefB